MTINLFSLLLFLFISIFYFLHFSLFIHGDFLSSSLSCLNLNSKQSYHISIVTVSLHIVTIRIFIKSPEEGRLDCPKYRENQLARRFFFAVFSL